MISIKIDVTKINKSKLYAGAKGTYLNCTMIETPNSAYDDYMIVEDTTKEERETGIKGVVLGNAKIIKPKQNEPIPPILQKPEEKDDLPF